MALSHISNRTRNKTSAGVLIICRVIIIRAGGASQKILKFFPSQCRKMCQKHPIPHLNTCITYLNTLARLSAPYLNTCNLNTLSRLSAPYLNTCNLKTLSRLHILIHCQLGNQSESSITSPALGALLGMRQLAIFIH